MEYRQIVAVTGLSGLYQLVSTKTDGAFVRSLADKTVKFVSARVHHITPLESIEIYTTGENVRLHEVLERMKGNDGSVKDLNNKKASNNDIKAYFSTILPEFDEDRVYTSDIKKVLKWYEILKANDLLNFDAYKQQEVNLGDIVMSDKKEDEAAEKPAKKATKKAAKETAPEEEAEAKPAKKTAKKAVKAAEQETEAKPAKKAAKKATAKAEGEEKPAKKTASKKKDAE